MGPSNKLNFHATYNNQKLIIDCDAREVAKEIAARFKINIEDFILYAVDKDERIRVSPHEVIDFMKIEIIPRKKGQKTMSTCNEEASNKKIVDNMICKLRQNTTLTGEERKLLIKALETHSTGLFSKRKLDQTDICQQTEEKSHKKIQVNFTNNKDSFTQTDSPVVENHVNNEDNARMTLKRLWNAPDKPFEEIDTLMTDTFNERRNFICIECPPVSLVKEQYPALFCVEQVKNELDRIFYPGKCLDFLNNMQKYSKFILHYKDDYSSDILEKTKKALSHARTPVQQAYAEVVGSVFVLAESLEENFGFIHLCDYPFSRKKFIFPHVDGSCHSLQETLSDKILLKIMVEGHELCEASNFPEAILCLMTTFFTFNIDYPKICRRTLIAFEKLYLESHDTKEMDNVTSKMINLLKKKANNSKNK